MAGHSAPWRHVAIALASAAPVLAAAPVSTAAALPRDSSAYVALAPARLADTRPGEPGAGGFVRIDAQTIRVDVAGRGGVPAGATAAVVTIASVDAAAAAFVVAYPAGTPRPTAASLNVDRPRRVVANLATVQLGPSGAIDLYANQPMHLVVDVAGAYVRVGDAVAAGRLITIAGGARRVLDTREGGGPPVGAGGTRRVTLDAVGMPADATAVVVNLAATEARPGYWTAYPLGPRPFVSSLNIDEVGQTRNAQAIVALSPGPRAFDVFSQSGGHLVVDVVGWFTGAASAVSSDGLFVPTSPIRMRDTRWTHALAPWGGSVIEVSAGDDLASLAGLVGAVAMNIAVTEPLDVGFVTASPAGLPRPLAANVNVTALDQIISNHAVVRVGTRGVALFTQSGTHMIVDVTGWYLGTPEVSVFPPPVNPSTATTRGTHVDAPTGRISTWLGYGDVDWIVARGGAALYGGSGSFGGPDHAIFFAHRTTGIAPFYYIDRIQVGDRFTITGEDGRRYVYLVTVNQVIHPDPDALLELAVGSGPATVSLVACHPPHSTRYRIVVVGRLLGLG